MIFQRKNLDRYRNFFLSNITFNLTASLQRKIYNLELEKSLLEKNNILESIDDAFISIEKDWTVNYWNKKQNNYLN